MNVNKLIVIFSLMLFIISCDKKSEFVIEKDKFVDLLVDIHKIDALLSTKQMNDVNVKVDSASYYNFVYKKHNVSRNEFDSTLKFYTERPEDFAKIYKLVIEKISVLKKDESLKTDVKKAVDSTNLWKLKEHWNLPADGEKSTIPFRIDATKSGSYNLSAEFCIYSDDKTKDLRMTIFAHYSDGTDDTKSISINQRDGLYKQYLITITTNANKKLEYLHGWVCDHSIGTKSKHMDIRNIKLTYLLIE